MENTGSRIFTQEKELYATEVNFCLIYPGVECDGVRLRPSEMNIYIFFNTARAPTGVL